MGGFAWVTLATNDSYSLGALVLAHSLKQSGTQQQLAVLVTPGVTNAMREKLATVFNLVQEVNILDSKDEANLRLLKRPELGVTFTKLHCWRLTQFDKCVFLDADTLVLQNCDELFEREELSAAPDVGWPDCFNSGVFVYRPSYDTYEKLVQFALEKGSFDGGDQGLLNSYFSDWAHKDISRHLPFIYNMCSTACYSYLPAFQQFGANAKIIHFIGSTKPWLQYFDTETRTVQPSGGAEHLRGVLQHWWNIFCTLIHPNLSPQMAGLAGAFAQLTLGEPRTAEQNALDDHLRRQGWEVGNIDYLGRDSFDNIWSKICQTLAEAPPQPVTTKPKEPTPPPVTKPDQPAEEVQQTLPQPVEQTTPKETSGDQVATEIPTPVVEPDIIIPLEDTAPKETAQPETNVSIAEIPAAKVAEVPTSPAQDLAQPPLESSTVSTPLEAKESLAAVQAPPEQVTPKTTTQVPVISPEQTSVPATPEPIIPVQTETKSPEPENASIAAVPVEKVPTPQQEPPTEVSKVEEPSVPSTQTTTELVTKSEEATVPAALTASTTAAEAPVPTEPATEAPAPKSLEPEASLVQVPTEHVPETPVPKSLEPEPSLVQIPTEHVTETPVSKVPEAEPSHTQVPAEPVTETPLPKLPEPEPSLAPVPAEPVTEAPSPKLQEPEPLVPIPSAPPTETAPKPAEATAPPTNVCPVLSKKHTESSKLQSDRPSKKTPKTSSPKPTPPSTPTETPKTLLTTAKSAETPKTPEVTQATPPTSPLAQDVVATQQNSKQSELGVSTAVPETPPPTGSAGAVPTPTPPPRKAGASTKKTTKSKKQ